MALPQLTLRGPRLRDDSIGIEHMAAEYRERRCVLVPQLLAPPLLHWVQDQIAAATLVAADHPGLDSTELRLENGTAAGLLAFLVNDPVMLRFVEAVSGRPLLTRFKGRVYSRVPGVHQDAWHDDIAPDRLVGMSVNLSTAVYEGGLFEMREADTLRPLGSLANTGFGDAILFAIDDALQHRVSPLRGTVAKTAYAGWFGAMKDYNASLRLSSEVPPR